MPIVFSNLSPVTDTVTSPSFTFDAPATATQVALATGPVVSGTATTMIDDFGTNAFETMNFANKTVATVNLNTSGIFTTVFANPAAGLTDLDINAGARNDNVDLETTPAGTTTCIVDTGAGAGSSTTLGTLRQSDQLDPG